VSEARAAVVVVTHDSRGDVGRCLDSVRHQPVPLEVVVVDNASTDGTPDLVRQRSPEAQVVALSENVGFGRACNLGARASTAPALLFLNPDASLCPGALPALLRILDDRPDVTVVGPRTRHPDGAIQVSTGPDLGLWREWRQRRRVLGVRARRSAALRREEARAGRESAPDWVSGSCLLVRRRAFEAVGGFDEGYFLYEEDADLCRRLRQDGGRVLFTPAADVVHRLGASMAPLGWRARVAYHRSHLRYYARHAGAPSRLLLRGFVLSRALVGWAAAWRAADAQRRRAFAELARSAWRGERPRATMP
jgi:GT2 family glycosyltransferase